MEEAHWTPLRHPAKLKWRRPPTTKRKIVWLPTLIFQPIRHLFRCSDQAANQRFGVCLEKIRQLLHFTSPPSFSPPRPLKTFFHSCAPNNNAASGSKRPIQTSPEVRFVALAVWSQALSCSRRTLFVSMSPFYFELYFLLFFRVSQYPAALIVFPWSRYSIKIMRIWSQNTNVMIFLVEIVVLILAEGAKMWCHC